MTHSPPHPHAVRPLDETIALETLAASAALSAAVSTSPSAAVPAAPASTEPPADTEAQSWAACFRDPQQAHQHPTAQALFQRQPYIDALRGLFSGAQLSVQLRLWCLIELAAQPQTRWDREALSQWLHPLSSEAMESALKKLRDLGLLVWDASTQAYQLSASAHALHPLLVSLSTPPQGQPDEDMADLLAQVAGAQQLGLVNAQQLRHLHAQLARLHDDFAAAIASGSEAQLRAAQLRFDRALELVDRAGLALSALIAGEHEDPRLEREARAIGQAQARLLAMASQFTRALQQADRQRVTLGSTGLTTSDVRAWLQAHPALESLLSGALSLPVRPVMVSQHDLLDVAEAELERERPQLGEQVELPQARQAQPGEIEHLSLPAELGSLLEQLQAWSMAPVSQDLGKAVLGGRFAQAAYRLQLLPLVGDAQAQTLKGQTGDLARMPWRWELSSSLQTIDDEAVSLMSEGALHPLPPPAPTLTSKGDEPVPPQ